jgi:hypothetical protein
MLLVARLDTRPEPPGSKSCLGCCPLSYRAQVAAGPHETRPIERGLITRPCCRHSQVKPQLCQLQPYKSSSGNAAPASL